MDKQVYYTSEALADATWKSKTITFGADYSAVPLALFDWDGSKRGCTCSHCERLRGMNHGKDLFT